MDNAPDITVLIADDHVMVRQGLRALIDGESDMRVVAEASNGSEAVEEFIRTRPQVGVIDLHMPVTDGVAAVASIISKVPHAALICLTSLDGDDFVYRAVRAGAKGYLLKNAPREELIACIRAVARGQTWLGARVAAKLADHIAHPNLTSRELEVLRLLGAAKSNKEIASRLGISTGTAKAHVNNLCKKL
ncbi:MAG: response regulator transcription factor, partial [Deltaproteobacteria bacterium]